MKSKRKAASSAYKAQNRPSNRAFRQFDSGQRESLPYPLTGSASGMQTGSLVVKENCGTPSHVPFLSRFDCVQKGPRRKVPITPTPRFLPFLDVVIRRAPPTAASAIDFRISRDAIYQHPTRPDILLGKRQPIIVDVACIHQSS